MRRRPIILVVEDDAATAAALERILPRWGYDVRSACSLAAALSAVEAGPFDLLLSDLVLPDGNGEDLCRQLQAGRHVPAIAVSGHSFPQDTERCKAAGFDRRLTKPVDLDLLFTAIQKTLDGTDWADDGAAMNGSTRMSGKVP